MKEQYLGQVRALLTALGSVLVVFGMHYGHAWEPVIGTLMVGASLAWGLYHKEGWDAFSSGFRKLVNAAGSAAVTYGVLSPEKSGAILGLVGPVLVLFGSWRANESRRPVDPDKEFWGLLMLLMALGLCLLPTGCVTPHGYQIEAGVLMDRATVTVSADRVVKITVDERSGK